MTPERSAQPDDIKPGLILSVRKRKVLQRLLNGEQRRCSLAALEAMHRCGWISGAGQAYQLTDQGRQIAELSESAPPGRDLQLDHLHN